jgi:hypothetical protein
LAPQGKIEEAYEPPYALRTEYTLSSFSGMTFSGRRRRG